MCPEALSFNLPRRADGTDLFDVPWFMQVEWMGNTLSQEDVDDKSPWAERYMSDEQLEHIASEIRAWKRAKMMAAIAETLTLIESDRQGGWITRSFVVDQVRR